MRKLGKKAYVQLQTNYGSINLELYCNMVPKTCWNFITLCLRGYYDGTTFHRLIKGFMIQGGDPTGKGTGGESAWKAPFNDEFDSRLSHDKKGILSMANAGVNTNGSQFFITFRATPHLDLVHSVFGCVVGGMATLDILEQLETNSKDNKPIEEVKLIKASVFQNPIDEANEILLSEVKSSIEASKVKSANSLPQKIVSNDHSNSLVEKSTSSHQPSVGKYLTSNAKDNKQNNPDTFKRQKIISSASSGFNNFSSW